MSLSTVPRVMWLLNHDSARKFEIGMMKRLGIREIFLPKRYPNEPNFRSASVDFSEDEHLTLSPGELDVLNASDWYGAPEKEAWQVANRHFDILFFLLHDPDLVGSIVRNFKGAVVLRAYGIPGNLSSYSSILGWLTKNCGDSVLRRLGPRFWFGHAYAHQAQYESGVLRERSLYLPVGMADASFGDQWQGHEKKILFICPDIGFSAYYKSIYQRFVADFKGLPYAIGGAQPIKVADENVLGFLPRDAHERNMRALRVMFYHSSEPNHIHYHPFEAIRTGMPLVFMAGGLLDRFGGTRMPGRCRNIREARSKVERILGDDRDLIHAIRASQLDFLKQMGPEGGVEAWRSGLLRIGDGLERTRRAVPPAAGRQRPRIAVILPIGYRGGSLRGARLLAEAIECGSRQAGQPVEVVFGHLDDPETYPEHEFSDWSPSIKRRPFKWRILDRAAAHRAMVYAGLERPMEWARYQVPDDGIRQFADCDLWVVVSDRLAEPLLPVRPYVLMVYDYLQRYVPILPGAINQQFISVAHRAERIFVTTEFTRRDALQFAGLPARRIRKLPMLAPNFGKCETAGKAEEGSPYFLWTTNLAPHKNHANAFKALSLYYEEMDGQCECRISGVNTHDLFRSDLPHLRFLRDYTKSRPQLRRRVKLAGELPDREYRGVLAGAQFLWHAGWIDNGTFSVIEAAYLGVPSLSSDYPAMREIDAQFSLGLNWMDAHTPADMARRLKWMEEAASAARRQLPSLSVLGGQSLESLAGPYWEAVRECL